MQSTCKSNDPFDVEFAELLKKHNRVGLAVSAEQFSGAKVYIHADTERSWFPVSFRFEPEGFSVNTGFSKCRNEEELEAAFSVTTASLCIMAQSLEFLHNACLDTVQALVKRVEEAQSTEEDSHEG